MTVPARAQGVGPQGRQSPLSGSSRAWYRLCTPEWGCPLHPILTCSSHQRSDLALGPHTTEKVQQRESVWGSHLGSQLKPIQGVCLFQELLAPPGSEWPSGIRDGTSLWYKKVAWQETAPSANSICLAGLGPKAHRLRKQVAGEDGVGAGTRCFRGGKAGKLSHRAGSLGALCQGQVANPFNVFVSLQSP